MKGHDGHCPTPNPHLVDRKNCAYCNLIENVRDYYKDKKATVKIRLMKKAIQMDGMLLLKSYKS